MMHAYEFCRYPLINFNDKKESDIIREYLSERYCVNKYDSDTFP